ncbi:hypothetical protein GCM10011459_21730 [Limosilactobacillus caviae]|uniref:Uncharacterized protein n=1 Tax=Limosilactobacillus caviae TaxID=1769424 RepID=A0ABQ2CAJ8_9LACO|nr:hypothetical protein GCM10011459_21730 [Limosilactobacillus caviae]
MKVLPFGIFGEIKLDIILDILKTWLFPIELTIIAIQTYRPIALTQHPNVNETKVNDPQLSY